MVKEVATMYDRKSILKDVREAVVGTPDNDDFDPDLIQYINSALATLNQVGVGRYIEVEGEDQKWSDFKNESQQEGNRYFGMIPLYVSLSTKLLFDPPPPSSVEYHSNRIQELLWRIKISYEETEGY